MPSQEQLDQAAHATLERFARELTQESYSAARAAQDAALEAERAARPS